MRKLYIYTGVTPNQDNGRHFMFTDVSLYMAELQPHLLTSVILDNYRINSNVAKLALSSLLTEENYDTVTYLIDYDEVTKYFRCYTVLRATLDTNVNYTLEVDLWATFIKDCDFSKVHITRCNRQLNEYGIYDEPQSTERAMQSEIAVPVNKSWLVDGYNDALAKLDSVYIVFLIQYNVKQSIFGTNDAVTDTKLVAMALSELEEIYASFPDYNILDIATAYVGCIYGVVGQNDAVIDAQVLQAWVLPLPLVYVTGTYITCKTRTKFTDGEIKAFYLRPEYNLTYLDFAVLPTNPNYVYYFGTINNGLKLKKYTRNTDRLTCRVQAFIGATTLRVLAMQGEEQKDITDAFEITLTSTASITTSIRQFAKTMGQALSLGQGMTKQIGKGDFVGAGLTGVGGFVEMLDTQKNLNKAIGNGDALTSYFINNPPVASVRNPFVVTKYLSVNDANKHTNMFGATFDYFANSGDAVTVFNFADKTMLGSGSIDDTYIVASCDIEGVPLEAHNEIGRKLTAGIYYKLLTV